MALDVVGRNAASGRVILNDTSPDGTVILLVCEAFEGPGAGVVLKQDTTPATGTGGYPWPKKNLAVVAEAERPKPFELVIDCAEFPSGPQRFRMTTFVDRALDKGVAGKKTEVKLTRENASEWGYIEAPADETMGELLE